MEKPTSITNSGDSEKPLRTLDSFILSAHETFFSGISEAYGTIKAEELALYDTVITYFRGNA